MIHQHTPGPWIVDGFSLTIVQDAAPRYFGQGQYSRAVICHLTHRQPADMAATLESDALLLAAAPSLLEMLRKLAVRVLDPADNTPYDTADEALAFINTIEGTR